MNTKIKLATFKEYKYHVDNHPPTGMIGVYGALKCSHCGRTYKDKGCDNLDITNAGGWYAAQIDCDCKNRFISYEDMLSYSVTITDATTIRVEHAQKKAKRVKSKYALVTTNQYVQRGPRDTDEVNCDVALKNQKCEGCGAPFMVEGFDKIVDSLIEKEESEYEVYCQCSANTDGGYSIVLYSDEAEDVYHNNPYEDDDDDDTSTDVTSIYGKVSCVLYVDGEEADFELASDELEDIVCEHCQNPFMTSDVDHRINLMIDNDEDCYELHCTNCNEPGNFLVLDYDVLVQIRRKHKNFEQEKGMQGKIESDNSKLLCPSAILLCDSYKVSHTEKPAPSAEDDFFATVDPEGLESSFFKA